MPGVFAAPEVRLSISAFRHAGHQQPAPGSPQFEFPAGNGIKVGSAAHQHGSLPPHAIAHWNAAPHRGHDWKALAIG
jgi:hypothetical protein